MLGYILLLVPSFYLGFRFLRGALHDFFPELVPGTIDTASIATLRTSAHGDGDDDDVDMTSVKSYDYVIVGGGTAGCVLASRLTEDRSITVLVIEPGHSDLKQIFSRIPGAFNKLFRTAADWNLYTTPQGRAGSRRMWWPRGKMLGGCSSMNAMIYMRCSPDDFDEWSRDYSCKGWAYKDLEPYFMKAEGFSPSASWPVDEAPHGQAGPWKVGYSWWTPLHDSFISACEKLGIKKVADINAGSGILGVTRLQTFIDPQGRRSSAAVSYLTHDVIKRPNLTIAVGQTATRILFDNKHDKKTSPSSSGQDKGQSLPRAIGVEMASSSSSSKYIVRANKEVILTAGAVHTPQLLMLSGLGPCDELARVGVPLVRHLSGVGRNLQDHIFVSLVKKAIQGASLMHLADPIKSIPPLLQWIRTGKGPMTTNVGEVAAFLRGCDLPNKTPGVRDLCSGPRSADLEILGAPVCYVDHGFHKPPPPAAGADPHAGDYVVAGIVGLRPDSVGSITLENNSIFTPPVINPDVLSTPNDREIMLLGLKETIKVMDVDSYKKHTTEWYWPPNADKMTDEQLSKFITESCETLYHPVGTAKMGDGNTMHDEDVVVNSRDLRVVGVSGLRVCDASLFPRIVAGHPCAVVIAIAEKFADMLKKEASLPTSRM